MHLNGIVTNREYQNNLSPLQCENIKNVIAISKKFADESGISIKDPGEITPDSIIIESGHQPNFLPYPGIFKKMYLLCQMQSLLQKNGKRAIPFFGFADQNICTAQLLFENQLPAYNKQGKEKIGFKISKNDKWKRFNTLKKPDEKSFQNAIETIIHFYSENMKKVKQPNSHIDDNLQDVCQILWKSYDKARTFSEMNEFIISLIATELFELEVYFFRYSDVQKNFIFCTEWENVIRKKESYSHVYNSTIRNFALPIPKITDSYLPFWYHCRCGGLADPQIYEGNKWLIRCPICREEQIIEAGGHVRQIKEQFSQISPKAVFRNLVFSEGLGTSFFISGSGGGLQYGIISNEMADHFNLNKPTSIAWKSRDYYLGISHIHAIREFNKFFDSTYNDVLDGETNELISRSREKLEKKMSDVTNPTTQKKELKKIKGKLANIPIQVELIRNCFSTTPSILDLLVNLNARDAINEWNIIVNNEPLSNKNGFYIIYADVSYNTHQNEIIPVTQLATLFEKFEEIEVT